MKMYRIIYINKSGEEEILGEMDNFTEARIKLDDYCDYDEEKLKDYKIIEVNV